MKTGVCSQSRCPSVLGLYGVIVIHLQVLENVWGFFYHLTTELGLVYILHLKLLKLLSSKH